jgi:hypothetical protein
MPGTFSLAPHRGMHSGKLGVSAALLTGGRVVRAGPVEHSVECGPL